VVHHTHRARTDLDRPVGPRRPARFHDRQRAGNPVRSHVLPTLHSRAEPTAQLTAYLRSSSASEIAGTPIMDAEIRQRPAGHTQAQPRSAHTGC